ncbi:MAG: hypothetical protein R3Y47_12105 [Lachnospiraceae bacterium]
MKTKTEFYKRYFEALDQKGFTVEEPSSPDYIADIFYRDRQMAFFTKQDSIMKNPFVEVEEKLLERIQNLAKTTAISCGVCSEKPYEDDKVKKLPNNVMQINEHNGVVLACKHHPLFEYVLSTYRMDTEHNNAAVQRQYFYNKEQAFESFATRSGLIDEKKLFSEVDLKMLHSGLIKMRTIDNDLTADDLNSVERLVDRIEDLIPELAKKEKTLDFAKFFHFGEQEADREI